MDFSLKKYRRLLEGLKYAGYTFITFKDYMEKSQVEKFVILRHDVDLRPENSLRFAQIQSELGIRGSYYFRAVPESWNEVIIKTIAEMGHEVGYHYENMDVAYSKLKQISINAKIEINSESNLVESAFTDFCINLEKLRKVVPVNTICMHGSPKSKFDNKMIWKRHDYKSLGIIGEPYYDVDFDKVFYLTDTGRRWDGWKTSVRDKVPQQEEWVNNNLIFHSTDDIIKAVRRREHDNEGHFPSQIMFTMHPQRWHSNSLPWIKEFILQNMKNIVKQYFYVNK